MIKVGITGGIGSGKSTISKILETLRYPVYYADARGKWLTEYNPIVVNAVKQFLGEDIYHTNGSLDRPKVAGIVFNDTKKLKQLNNIIHPAVGNDFKEWCKNQHSDIVFKEAAIMFESGANMGLDKVICITAPENTRVERVKLRDKSDEEQIRARMRNQMAEQERIDLSDFVIFNDGKQFVFPQVMQIITQLKSITG